MRTWFRERGSVGLIVAIFLVVVIVNLTIGALCTEYVVEYWASYSKGYAVDVPFGPCIVAGLFLGELAIPAAIVTWIMSFFL